MITCKATRRACLKHCRHADAGSIFLVFFSFISNCKARSETYLHHFHGCLPSAVSIGTDRQRMCKHTHAYTIASLTMANGLLMINDHNENTHASPSHSQVLHKDKHDTNKRCFSLAAFLFFSSSFQLVYLS